MKLKESFVRTTNPDYATAVEKGMWRLIGPGGGGGHFLPTVSPHNPDTALIACDMTGSYITHDAGKSWRQFNIGGRAHSFAFHPSKPDVIFAGASSLFRSEDNGETWKLICPNPDTVIGDKTIGDEAKHDYLSSEYWPGGIVQGIRVDPGKPERIYIAVKSKEHMHIFHSADNGTNWSELCRVEGSRFHSIYIDSSRVKDDNKLYIFTDAGVFTACTGSGELSRIRLPGSIKRLNGASCGYNPETGKVVLYITSPTVWVWNKYYSGVWKSTDLGQSWQLLNSGLDRNPAARETDLTSRFTYISACEYDARTVYIAAHQYLEAGEDPMTIISYYGILKSTNEGHHWDWVLRGKVNEDPVNKKKGWVERDYDHRWYWIGPKGTYLIGLGACASNPDICYATDIGAGFRTLDGGASWEQIYSKDHPDGTVTSTGMDVTTCYGVHFDPFDKDHIVISYTDLGMFRSKNGGKTWIHSINGVSVEWGNTCYWMVFDPDVKGRAWSVWAFAHDLPRTKMYPPGSLYSADGGVCRTEDGIETWKVSSDGLPPNCIATHILLDPSSPAGKRTLYITGFGTGVFKSTDDGYTWTQMNNGIRGNLNAWKIYMDAKGKLYLIIARGLDDGKVVDGAMYVSSDGAESWTELPLPKGVNGPHDIAFDPENHERIYLTCWPRIADGRSINGGIYISEDGGHNWENVFDDSYHMYSVAVDPDNPSVVAAVSFESAAFRSEDRGRTWKPIEGYKFKWGHRPIFDPHNKGMMYITTFGSSVWYGPVAGNPQ